MSSSDAGQFLEEEEFLTLKQVAKTLNISEQGVGMAVRRKTLRTVKQGWRYYVTRSELNRYVQDKLYRPSHSGSGGFGPRIFNYPRGLLDVAGAAMVLRRNEQHIYYLLRTKQLKARKYGGVWLIFMRDVLIYSRKKGIEPVLKIA
jgi:excisionase family DNA binding protein